MYIQISTYKCVYKSQWKIDFLSIFYPIFPDLCYFIKLWKITPFFYNNFFGFGGGGSFPLTPAGAHDFNIVFSQFNEAGGQFLRVWTKNLKKKDFLKKIVKNALV